MTPQDWESPETLRASGGGAAYGGSEQAAAYALRPLSTGEVLDPHLCKIYSRAQFLVVCGAGVADGRVQFDSECDSDWWCTISCCCIAWVWDCGCGNAGDANGVTAISAAAGGGGGMQASVFAFVRRGVFGPRRTTAKESLQATIGRWLRYVGIAIWQGWSAIWVVLVLVVPGDSFL